MRFLGAAFWAAVCCNALILLAMGVGFQSGADSAGRGLEIAFAIMGAMIIAALALIFVLAKVDWLRVMLTVVTWIWTGVLVLALMI